MAVTVIGVYDNYTEAQSALNELLASGFARTDITLSPSEDSPTARQSLLSSNQSTSSDTGSGIGHFFRQLFGMSEQSEHADVYSEALRRGSYLVSVDAKDERQRDQATDIMNRYDPIDIDERATQWKSQGWSGYDPSTPVLSSADIANERSSRTKVDNEISIPVIQEELAVGKRQVQRGGVRVYQRVTETPVQETVNLRDEKVTIERHAVDQPATEADLAAFKEGSFELRETAEEAVVAKTARIVEEVVVNRETTERAETVSDTVRRSDVEVEKLSGSEMLSSGDDEFRRHWQTAYGASGGRYEDYAPAYRYGAETAGSTQYKGHRWADAEPSIRRDWESRNPGSTWEKVKESVRYGWDRMTK